jgi:hypothetical protein
MSAVVADAAEKRTGDPPPEALVGEWRPTRGTWAWWWTGGTILASAAAFFYEWIAGHGQIPTEFSINLVLLVILVLAFTALHEGVHGLAMLAFGARPQFGVLRTGRIPQGFYTTSPGHRFRRHAYIVITLAPLVVIAPLGVPLCWSSLGSVLWLPLGVHLGGCVGDLTIAKHVISGPPAVVCEDLRDGLRFWSAPRVG